MVLCCKYVIIKRKREPKNSNVLMHTLKNLVLLAICTFRQMQCLSHMQFHQYQGYIQINEKNRIIPCLFLLIKIAKGSQHLSRQQNNIETSQHWYIPILPLLGYLQTAYPSSFVCDRGSIKVFIFIYPKYKACRRVLGVSFTESQVSSIEIQFKRLNLGQMK